MWIQKLPELLYFNLYLLKKILISNGLFPGKVINLLLP
jgi:hypothetical protein